MFPDLSWSHMLLVLIVALVVVGPKDLPKLMRKMGQWTAKARGMADQFRRSFDDMARQSELDELRKELDELRTARPFSGIEQQINEQLAPPTVSIDPDAAATGDPAADAAPKAEPAIDHDLPVPPSAEPAEPLPQTDQHPPAP